MEGQITFNQVKVQTLNDQGAAPSPKYAGYVGLQAEYDPEVRDSYLFNFLPVKLLLTL